MTGHATFRFGAWVGGDRLGAAQVPALLADARRQARATAPPARVFEAIRAMGDLWQKDGHCRRTFLATEPWVPLHLSRPMMEWALDAFAARLAPEYAAARFDMQIGQRCRMTAGAAHVLAEPLGVVLEVVSGNIFPGPVEALLAALVTGNVVIVKTPSGQDAFLWAIVETLASVATDLARQVALVAWQGGDRDIEQPLAGGVDAILVAAGPETIAAYRSMCGPTTVLVEFGPRISIAVVTAAGVAGLDADGLARDVGLWDQAACTAAQCVLVEGEAASRSVAEKLGDALRRLALELPAAPAALDTRIEIGRLRAVAQFAAAAGPSRVLASEDEAAGWTVVWEQQLAITPSPLHRFVRVSPFSSFDELLSRVGAVGGLLQTVGLACAAGERPDLECRLARAGARRLCPIGCMNLPDPVAPHDGVLELSRLVRWVAVQGPP